VTLAGVETVIGVDSYAAPGCVEAAHYRRTDAWAAFLDPYAAASADGADAGDAAPDGSVLADGGAEDALAAADLAPAPGVPIDGAESSAQGPAPARGCQAAPGAGTPAVTSLAASLALIGCGRTWHRRRRRR
jgi:hypothetical protein